MSPGIIKYLRVASTHRYSSFSKSFIIVSNTSAKRKKELKEIGNEVAGLMETLRTAGSGQSRERVLKWLDEQLVGLDQKKSEIQESILKLKSEQQDLSEARVDANSLKKSLKAVFDRLNGADPAVKRGIARQLFKSIKLCVGNRLEVSWNLPLSCGSGGKYSSNKNEWGGARY